MLRFWVAALAFALCLGGADKPKNRKAADIEILEVAARRNEDNVTLDGKLRNTSEKAIRGLVLSFDFKAPDGTIVTTQHGACEDDDLAPKAETSFHMQLANPPRSVVFKINALDEAKRSLRVANGGPLAIE